MNGGVLSCEFRYTDPMGNVRVEAQRSGIVPVGAKGNPRKFRPSEQLMDFLREIDIYLIRKRWLTLNRTGN